MSDKKIKVVVQMADDEHWQLLYNKLYRRASPIVMGTGSFVLTVEPYTPKIEGKKLTKIILDDIGDS